MTEPTVICPKCKTEIKLTESLAAPLVEAIRGEYEQRLAQKDADVSKREAGLRQREEALEKDKRSVDEQVSQKLKLERVKIAAEALIQRAYHGAKYATILWCLRFRYPQRPPGVLQAAPEM